VALATEPIELWTAFAVAKIIALAVATLCANLARLRLKEKSLFVMSVIIIPIVLFVNILEAVASDAFSGYDDVDSLLPFYVNAIGGVALAISVVFFARSGRVCDSSYLAFQSITKAPTVPHYLLDTPRLWCFAYTIWNIAFAYGYSSNICDTMPTRHGHYTLRIICVLVIPLVSEFILKGSWLEARCYSLVFDFSAIEVFCTYKEIDRLWALVDWYTTIGHWVLAAVCFALSVGALAVSFWVYFKQRGQPLPQEFLQWNQSLPQHSSDAILLASSSTPSPSHQSAENKIVFSI